METSQTLGGIGPARDLDPDLGLELAPDTIVERDRTAPLPPLVRTVPLAKPLARTVIDAPHALHAALTYAVHEPGAALVLTPRAREADYEESLAREHRRKHLGLAALGIATISALTIAFFASNDEPTGRAETTSAAIAASSASSAPKAASLPPPATTLTMTPTPGMGPAFTPVAPLPKVPPLRPPASRPNSPSSSPNSPGGGPLQRTR